MPRGLNKIEKNTRMLKKVNRIIVNILECIYKGIIENRAKHSRFVTLKLRNKEIAYRIK